MTAGQLGQQLQAGTRQAADNFNRFVEGEGSSRGGPTTEKKDFWDSFGAAPAGPSAEKKDFWDSFAAAGEQAQQKKTASLGTAHACIKFPQVKILEHPKERDICIVLTTLNPNDTRSDIDEPLPLSIPPNGTLQPSSSHSPPDSLHESLRHDSSPPSLNLDSSPSELLILLHRHTSPHVLLHNRD